MRSSFVKVPVKSEFKNKVMLPVSTGEADCGDMEVITAGGVIKVNN